MCYYLERTSVSVEETLQEILPETIQPIPIERIHESPPEPILKESPDYFLFDEDTGTAHKI